MHTGNRKRKSAYTLREKLTVFFKKAAVIMCGIAAVAAIVLVIMALNEASRVKEIAVSGNYRLDKADIINSLRAVRGEPLLNISFRDVDERLRKNAWIKKVSIRKQFPDSLVVKIEEAVPRALLSLKDELYLIDGEGAILERMKGDTASFLPVIKDIDPKNRRGITEALKLIEALSANKVFDNRESIEIGLESYGLIINIDGDLIKVGYGQYPEKFKKWMDLEPEIRKRGVLIKYVDLRFKDSVIVKPLEEDMKKEKGEASS